jgi:hypothetical protein
MFPLISSITQQQHPAASFSSSLASSLQAVNQNPPSTSPLQPPAWRRWSNSSWGGAWHCNRRSLHSYFSEFKQLRKSSCVAFCILLSSAVGAVPSSTCRLLSTSVLMSRSHRLLIICSPHWRDMAVVKREGGIVGDIWGWKEVLGLRDVVMREA